MSRNYSLERTLTRAGQVVITCMTVFGWRNFSQNELIVCVPSVTAEKRGRSKNFEKFRNDKIFEASIFTNISNIDYV